MEQEITPPKGSIVAHKVEAPQKTFFFERFDGSVICVQEVEAHNLLKGRGKALGPVRTRPKLIGVSDGTKFHQAVVEAHALHKSGETQKALDRLRQGEQEELESARGHIERPRDFDFIDMNRNPVNLRTMR